MKHYRLVMKDGELRLRMKDELKKAIRKESRRLSDKKNKYISMACVIRRILMKKYKTENLKKAILEDSRKRTDENGALISMNKIVNEILESTLLKR